MPCKNVEDLAIQLPKASDSENQYAWTTNSELRSTPNLKNINMNHQLSNPTTHALPEQDPDMIPTYTKGT